MAEHPTTLMVTRDEHLKSRGDCVVAVASEASLSGLPEEMRAAARSEEAVVRLTIEAGEESFTVTGKGHKLLTYSSGLDMVARRSRYTCGRTMMVEADAAAADVPRRLVGILRDPEAVVKLTLRVTARRP